MKCQYIFRNFDKINLIYRSFISAGTPLGSNVAKGSAEFRQHNPNTAPSVQFPTRFPLWKHVFSKILETQDALRCFTMQTHSKDTHANGDAGLPTHERMARFICKWRSTTQKPRREFPPGLSVLQNGMNFNCYLALLIKSGYSPAAKDQIEVSKPLTPVPFCRSALEIRLNPLTVPGVVETA